MLKTCKTPLPNIFSWIPALAVTLFIFSTLSFVPQLWADVLSTHGAATVRGWAKIIFILLLSVAILFLLLDGKGNKGCRLLWLFIVALVFGHLIQSTENVVEQVHFLEYGLLGILYFIPLKRYIQDKMIFWVAWLIVFLVGMADEWIQFYLPDRVGELQDIYLNGAASGLVIILLAKVFPSHGFCRAPALKSIRIFSYLLITLMISLGNFTSTVMDWGFRHKAPGVGIFYSRFPLDKLIEMDSKKGDKYAKFIKDHYPAKMSVYLKNQKTSDKFAMEVMVHLFRRDSYERKGNYWVALKENMILSGYFSKSITGSGHGWPKEKESEILRKMKVPAEKFYESPVSKSDVIVYFGPLAMWACIFVASAVIFWGMERAKRRFK